MKMKNILAALLAVSVYMLPAYVSAADHVIKAGSRAFPRLVPVDPNNPASEANRAAWKILEQWHKPFLTCFSNGDPITRGGDKYMQGKIPGAKGQPHVTLTGGHFLQEDSGAEFALEVNRLIERL